MSQLRPFLRIFLPHWPWLALGGLLGVIAIGSSIGLMALSAYLISRAAIAGGVAELALAVTGVRVLAISRAGFRYLERYVTHRAMFRTLVTIRTWFYAAAEPLAPARLVQLRNGDLMTRLVADVDAMEELSVRVLVPPVVAAVVIALVSLAYGLFDAAMGVLLLAFLLFTAFVLPIASHWLSRRPASSVADLRGECGALVVDQLQGAAELAVMDAAGGYRAHLLARGAEMDAVRRHLGAIEGVSDALVGLLAALAGLSILVLAIPLVTEGRVEGVFLAALPLAAIAAFEAVQPLSRSLQSLETTRGSARRLLDVVQAEPAVVDPVTPLVHPGLADRAEGEARLAAEGMPAADDLSATREPAVAGQPAPVRRSGLALDIRGLAFRYGPVEPWVLRDLDLEMRPGERVAVVGPSGCGKSTLLALLLRFWEYEQGTIRLAGMELRAARQEDARALISAVPQDVHVFDASIRSNLAVARGTATQAEMEAACRVAQLHEVIASLPEGYDTLLGENGVRLSSGERRRLAVARAVLKGAPLVVLDEATADLDTTTAAALWSAVDAWLAGRTTIVLGHEPSPLAGLGQVVDLSPASSAGPAAASRGKGRPGPDPSC